MKHAISFVETNSMREKTLRKKNPNPKGGIRTNYAMQFIRNQQSLVFLGKE